MKPSIVVIGSSNTDMVIQTDHIPAPGETILGGKFFMNPGGKGANQAVAAARLGGNVVFVARTGNDIFGKESRSLFEKEGIDTSFLTADDHHPSGVALITVDKRGENSIAVASGSNAELREDDVLRAQYAIEKASFVLMQLEVPVATVVFAANLAAEKNVPVLLNPAPALALSDDLLRKTSIITPNQTEAELLSGVKVEDIESAARAATVLHQRGVATVIITLGADGAWLSEPGDGVHIPAIKVEAIDTTAAGDVFNGALAVALSEGKSMKESVAFANRASGISVTRLGAQTSAPYRRELT